MEKEIKKWGHSNIIVLSPEDLRIRKLETGDVVDVQIKKIKALKKGGKE